LGKLSDAKILGGIGSILEIIPVASIVGYILTLIAVKFVSDEVQDGTIFNDMIYAVVAGIVGVGVGAFILFFGAISSVFTLGVGALVGVAAFLVIAWIALLVSSLFIRRAFGKIADRLNVGTFRTAGTLYFVGAILTIVLVGVIILFVAYIVQIIAFFSIPESLPSMQASTAAPMAPQSTGSKYCSSCGTQMPSAATFCPKCGARQA
jgi:uncharacterized membrane protein/ribosomal protein L40E